MQPLPPAPPSFPPPPAPPAGRLPVLIVVDEMPAGMPSSGTRFQTHVDGLRPDGGVDLKTPFGTLRAHPSQPVADGAALVVTVHATAPRLILRVVATVPPSVPTKPGGEVGASHQNAAAGALKAPLAVGTVLKGLALPDLPAASGTQPGTAARADGGAGAPGGPHVTMRLLSAGSTALPLPTGAVAAGISGPSADGAAIRPVLATVVDMVSPRQAVLAASAGRFLVETPVPLPPGWTAAWDLRLPASAGPGATATGAAGGQPPMPAAAAAWALLNEAWHVVSPPAGPTDAASPLAGVVPRPDAQLAANILRFLGFVQQGDAARWLGEEGVRSLDAARRGLASRLGEAARDLARGVDDAGGSWRLITVPMAYDGELGFLRLLIREHPDDRPAAEPVHADPFRFVVDVHLSRLGRVQLDAMVKQDPRGQSLDLLVRSDPPLAASVQDAIRGLFRTTAEALGLTGQVGFRASPPGFVAAAASGSTAVGPGLFV